MADVQKYLALIPNYNATKPKFTGVLKAIIDPLVDVMNFLEKLPSDFDIDTAIGAQLDVDGEWIGRTRFVDEPIPNVFFSFGVEGLGWGQGVWKGPFDIDAGVIRLDDETYRLLLRAKIAANHWDGTMPGAKEVLETIFINGETIFIQDNQDMSMTVGVSGQIPSALALALLSEGYIPLKPVTVKVNYYVVSVNNTPMFGFGLDNQYISGFGIGSWGRRI